MINHYDILHQLYMLTLVSTSRSFFRIRTGNLSKHSPADDDDTDSDQTEDTCTNDNPHATTKH